MLNKLQYTRPPQIASPALYCNSPTIHKWYTNERTKLHFLLPSDRDQKCNQNILQLYSIHHFDWKKVPWLMSDADIDDQYKHIFKNQVKYDPDSGFDSFWHLAFNLKTNLDWFKVTVGLSQWPVFMALHNIFNQSLFVLEYSCMTTKHPEEDAHVLLCVIQKKKRHNIEKIMQRKFIMEFFYPQNDNMELVEAIVSVSTPDRANIHSRYFFSRPVIPCVRLMAAVLLPDGFNQYLTRMYGTRDMTGMKSLCRDVESQRWCVDLFEVSRTRYFLLPFNRDSKIDTSINCALNQPQIFLQNRPFCVITDKNLLKLSLYEWNVQQFNSAVYFFRKSNYPVYLTENKSQLLNAIDDTLNNHRLELQQKDELIAKLSARCEKLTIMLAKKDEMMSNAPKNHYFGSSHTTINPLFETDIETHNNSDDEHNHEHPQNIHYNENFASCEEDDGPVEKINDINDTEMLRQSYAFVREMCKADEKHEMEKKEQQANEDYNEQKKFKIKEHDDSLLDMMIYDEYINEFTDDRELTPNYNENNNFCTPPPPPSPSEHDTTMPIKKPPRK